MTSADVSSDDAFDRIGIPLADILVDAFLTRSLNPSVYGVDLCNSVLIMRVLRNSNLLLEFPKGRRV